MCGRFTLRASPQAIATLFDLPSEPAQLAPRYNIAPTQPVGVVRVRGQEAEREWTHMRWGLIPSWAKDPSIGSRMINARSETAAEKPSFRAPFKRRRCLIPVDGFYEWKREDSKKQPYYITLHEEGAPNVVSVDGASDATLFAIAGLWEFWQSPDGSGIETCTLLTTEANEMMESLHHRMPVIVHPDDYGMWLEPTEEPAYLSELRHLMRPYNSEVMQARAVSTFVNNARNEGPECVA